MQGFKIFQGDPGEADPTQRHKEPEWDTLTIVAVPGCRADGGEEKRLLLLTARLLGGRCKRTCGTWASEAPYIQLGHHGMGWGLFLLVQTLNLPRGAATEEWWLVHATWDDFHPFSPSIHRSACILQTKETEQTVSRASITGWGWEGVGSGVRTGVGWLYIV